MSSYQSTTLWRNSLGKEFQEGNERKAVERLRSAFQGIRERASQLTSRISADFPDLTMHDATHLDALWHTGSLVAGDHYPISPLEGFVLGASFLLHDAGLTFEAYEGGQAGLRATSEWADSYAVALQRGAAPQQELEKSADFATIRLLHARQAETLLEHQWKNPATGTTVQLLDDEDIRGRLGSLIGAIAASHHWPIEDVLAKLPAQVPSPNGFPARWRVDPVKLACILRCADAAHLDDKRAPDFLFALLRRSNVSTDHWIFQNWLNPVDVDVTDGTGETLLFTSTRAFPADFADAWWVAHDAIALLAKEISASNSILESRPQGSTVSPPLGAKRIKGSESPGELAKYVTTTGWVPRAAELHIGNVRRLVEMLGGSQLYGNGPDRTLVVLRELLQNARDAVVARRNRDAGYKGRIVVRSRPLSGGKIAIGIDDDGLGMSERVLTGPLLDFGQSFWTSELVREEFPGLLSSGFRSIGRYGIGFFSIFMIAASATVSSRQYQSGLDDVVTLTFPNGLTLRPTVSRSRPSEFTSYTSTLVTIVVDQDVHQIDPFVGDPKKALNIPLSEYLSILTLGLDVEVIFEQDDGRQDIVHRPVDGLSDSDRIGWLKSLAPPTLPDAGTTHSIMHLHAARLKSVEGDGKIVGLAALGTTLGRFSQLSFQTVGGLSASLTAGYGGYVGYFDSAPANAKRDAGKRLASEATLQAWANEQLQLIGPALSNPVLATVVSYNLSMIPIDPYAIAHAVFYEQPGKHPRRFLSLDQVLDEIQNEPMAVYVVRIVGIADVYTTRGAYKGHLTFEPISLGAYPSVIDRPDNALPVASFFHCLERRAKERNLVLQREIVESIAAPPFDQIDVYFFRALNANAATA